MLYHFPACNPSQAVENQYIHQGDRVLIRHCQLDLICWNVIDFLQLRQTIGTNALINICTDNALGCTKLSASLRPTAADQ